ncbi:MAG TPA: HU family DNA-binding protein [Candidatus Baltobacteraceae bacterium]|nr:HU family DNA-binding protein [Candidatus Baltobacteraceae bacterium]
MTKNELVRELAEDFEVPRRQVADLVEAMFEKIVEVLKSGDKVQLTPFGQFRIRDRAARLGRNPATGEQIQIPAKRVLKFTAGRTLKDAVGAPTRRGAGGAKKGAAKKAGAKKAGGAKKAASKAGARKAAATPARKGAAGARKATAGRKKGR